MQDFECLGTESAGVSGVAGQELQGVADEKYPNVWGLALTTGLDLVDLLAPTSPWLLLQRGRGALGRFRSKLEIVLE